MVLLTLFAFIAGAATAVSPCVLPVLPALLAAGAAGGRRRPLGIVLGLALTFTITIVGLAEVVDGVGLGDGILRDVAIAVLALAGLLLFVPALAARVEAPLSRLARWGPQSGGDGFWSGIGVGAALGFVYAPCAGPILAAVITVGAATGETVIIGAAYAIGSSVVLLALALVGRRMLTPLRRGRRMATLQRAAGAVMVLTAVAMAFELDIRFQETIADDLPTALVYPTSSLEKSDVVQDRLTDLRGAPKFAAQPGPASSLPVLGTAPEFVGNQRWFNTADGRPLTLAGLRGKVVLIDFWTYTCINCIRTLPYLKAWYEKYRDQGLVIVGVHSPEFAFEKDAGNVARAIGSDGIEYPVAQDNDLATWGAWGNNAWPAKYLIDARGEVRYAHIGEGEYAETEEAIRELLAEAGADELSEDRAQPGRTITPGVEATPETYLGTQRAEGFTQRPRLGTNTYRATPGDALDTSRFSLGGIWTHDLESARAGIGATLSARVRARDVYLVLSPPPKRDAGRVQVSVDGRVTKTVVVRRQRLYTLADFPQTGTHVLELRFEPGVAGYAFTFG
ncbi:MAG: cytochrome c biogenesis protein DipZ [Solirubrobacteraceae bacterium]